MPTRLINLHIMKESSNLVPCCRHKRNRASFILLPHKPRNEVPMSVNSIVAISENKNTKRAWFSNLRNRLSKQHMLIYCARAHTHTHTDSSGLSKIIGIFAFVKDDMNNVLKPKRKSTTDIKTFYCSFSCWAVYHTIAQLREDTVSSIWEDITRRNKYKLAKVWEVQFMFIYLDSAKAISNW